eukprot:scaffold127154_cov45-Attheya_sp.AAC.1
MFMDSDGKDTMVIQKLGATFRVDYHPPMIDAQAPQMDKGSQVNFNFTAKHDTWMAPVTIEANAHADALRTCLAQSMDDVAPTEEYETQDDPTTTRNVPKDAVYMAAWHQ